MINIVILWSIITLFRFGQSLAIWWFILTLFRRSFKENKTGFIISSFCISIIILFYNAIHIQSAFLIFALEVPFFILTHLIIIKKGWSMAIIESVIGYYIYRITESEIAMLFNCAHIISIEDAVTKAKPAILMQFIIPFIVVYLIQMLLVRKKWGYYFINNKIMPSKPSWVILTFNSGVILYYFYRLMRDLSVFNHTWGWDEQPYLIFFIGLNLFILWMVNKKEWENHYSKQSISCFYRKKSIQLNLKKVRNHL